MFFLFSEKLKLVIKMSKRQFRKERKKKRKLNERYEKQLEQIEADVLIYESMEKNVEFIQKILGKPVDLITREFTMQYNPDKKAAILFIDELVVKDQIHNFILRPLMLQGERITLKSDIWETAVESLVQIGETAIIKEMRKAIDAILAGDTILFIDGYAKGLVIGTRGWDTRSVSDPRAENVVRGSREGMSETITVSLGMIRRRLRDPDLRVDLLELGRRTKTDIGLLYIKGIVDPKIVKEIKRRLQQINIDGVLESGYIEELIMDQVWSPFPQIQNTERPDAVVGHLLEGKVALIIDGTPHVLIAPAVFTQFYHSAEDYFERYLISTALRVIRVISLFIALLLPAIYIALVSFHPEMIPNPLAIAMAGGRAVVPFIPIVEAILMEFSVEILREASIRLPGPIGPTIGIVGALVIGEAAVTAGLVSPAMVIVVGLTTISSYANPNYNAAISIRLLRFPFMIAAATFGLYGIMILIFLLFIHLSQLKSFGVPYMAPFGPLQWRDLKDSFIRVPWNFMIRRPSIYRPQDKKRQKVGNEQ